MGWLSSSSARHRDQQQCDAAFASSCDTSFPCEGSSVFSQVLTRAAFVAADLCREQPCLVEVNHNSHCARREGSFPEGQARACRTEVARQSLGAPRELQHLSYRLSRASLGPNPGVRGLPAVYMHMQIQTIITMK